MRREPDSDESEGQAVLWHLEAIVAWHAAATSLLDRRYRHVAQNFVVELVEVTSNKPNLMTGAQVKGRAIDVPTVHYRAILHGRHVNSTVARYARRYYITT